MYILVILITIGIAFSFQRLLFNLFPHSGLQGIISFPILFILGIIAGIIVATLISSQVVLTYKIILSTFLLIAMFFIQIVTYPQDGGASTINKIINSITATKKFESINQEDFTEYNHEQQIVYNAKFNRNSDKTYYTIWNSTSKKKHFITKENGELKFDGRNLKIDKSIIPNLIIEIQSDGTKTKYQLESLEKLLNIKNGGCNDWSVRKFNDKYVGYEIILNTLNKKKDYR
ncbi:MAG: hypothetical protein ACI81Y_002715 [Glaciecola sp.]|jgi:hypothetical protein